MQILRKQMLHCLKPDRGQLSETSQRAAPRKTRAIRGHREVTIHLQVLRWQGVLDWQSDRRGLPTASGRSVQWQTCTNSVSSSQMLDYEQLKAAIGAAQRRFAMIRKRYPELKAHLVLSSPKGQTKIDSSPTQILTDFPAMVVADGIKARVLDLLNSVASMNVDDPERKRPQKQADTLAVQLKFDETCQVEIRFGDLNYELVWKLQADELVDWNLTPKTKASIRIVLGTLDRFQHDRNL